MNGARTDARPMKGALVGYGFTGARGHTPAYLQRRDVEIVAVVDKCHARRAVVPKVLPAATTYESVQALFASGIDLDFVDIATPATNHFVIAHEAMKRGVHVLCETPLTTEVADAQALVECALASKRVLFPCHNHSFATTVRAISDVVSSGRIGRIRSVKLETFRPTHAQGVLEWNPDWRSQGLGRGGGIDTEWGGIDTQCGSHTFPLAFDWLNAWPTALTAKIVNPGDDRWETERCFSTTLRFPRGADCPRARDLDRGTPGRDLHGPRRTRGHHRARRRPRSRHSQAHDRTERRVDEESRPACGLFGLPGLRPYQLVQPDLRPIRRRDRESRVRR